MEYSSGGVPPEAEMLMDPGFGIFAVVVVIIAEMGVGSAIVSVWKADKHNFESRTKDLYIPEGSPVKLPAVCQFKESSEYSRAPVPPEADRVMEPVLSPKQEDTSVLDGGSGLSTGGSASVIVSPATRHAVESITTII